MIKTVRTYIHKYKLLSAKEPVLVGLSGGADSVALLAVLVRLGYTCMAIHCNFHLRGEESDRDERFAREFAENIGVPFYKTDFDTTSYAKEKHISIEMAARELRYQWFEEMRFTLKAQAIAVAHHRDDNIETVLMNLIRGSGIRGMRGIKPRNGYIVRPLLTVSREEIISWLLQENYTYITDSSNLSDVYTRNYIRLEILPALEKINPSVRETIRRTTEHLAAVDEIYQYVIKEAREKVITTDNHVSIPLLLQYPSPETVLYELLKPYGFNRILCNEIYESLNKTSGKLFFSSDFRLIKDRDYLLITPIAAHPVLETYTVTEENKNSLPVKLSWQETVLSKEFVIEKEKDTAYFDLNKLHFPLTLRRWQKGDWFVPFGMSGRKKLSDYFSDQKFSLQQKEDVWLLCSGKDIIWIVGERSDNRFRINKETKQVLRVKKNDQKV